mmetsp:Transcript_17553/g.20235  ORF Transcript_17553/g.20235 Transcript_17553/m.20235 type:complete len:84 (+) Transcript_17553:218-469(+)
MRLLYFVKLVTVLRQLSGIFPGYIIYFIGTILLEVTQQQTFNSCYDNLRATTTMMTILLMTTTMTQTSKMNTENSNIKLKSLA